MEREGAQIPWSWSQQMNICLGRAEALKWPHSRQKCSASGERIRKFGLGFEGNESLRPGGGCKELSYSCAPSHMMTSTKPWFRQFSQISAYLDAAALRCDLPLQQRASQYFRSAMIMHLCGWHRRLRIRRFFWTLGVGIHGGVQVRVICWVLVAAATRPFWSDI